MLVYAGSQSGLVAPYVRCFFDSAESCRVSPLDATFGYTQTRSWRSPHRLIMKKQIIQFAQGSFLIPFLTIGSPFAILNNTKATPIQIEERSVSIVPAKDVILAKERADKIDAYYKKHGMPLEGYGAKMVAEAEKNNLDWRLLPAIAIRESSGGKDACNQDQFNTFGWASCDIDVVKFKSFNDAIETVARNLGGNNPNTAYAYKDKTIIQKLARYNSVILEYTDEIFEFMDLIEKGK